MPYCKPLVYQEAFPLRLASFPCLFHPFSTFFLIRQDWKEPTEPLLRRAWRILSEFLVREAKLPCGVFLQKLNLVNIGDGKASGLYLSPY